MPAHASAAASSTLQQADAAAAGGQTPQQAPAQRRRLELQAQAAADPHTAGLPPAAASEAVPPAVPPAPQTALPEGWRRAMDTSNRPYYWHVRTREVQWGLPPPAQQAQLAAGGGAQQQQQPRALRSAPARGLPSLPADIWNAIARQGLAPRDLARLSQASRACYGIAHEITAVKSIVGAKFSDGSLPAHLVDPSSVYGCTKEQQRWLPALEASAFETGASSRAVHAWPHLVFAAEITEEHYELGRPWLQNPNVLLILSAATVLDEGDYCHDCDEYHYEQVRTQPATNAAFAEYAAKNRVHSLTIKAATAGGHADTTVAAEINAHSVQMHRCRSVQDLAVFSRVHAVDLSCSSTLTDVAGLAGVHTVCLSGLVQHARARQPPHHHHGATRRARLHSQVMPNHRSRQPGKHPHGGPQQFERFDRCLGAVVRAHGPPSWRARSCRSGCWRRGRA